MRNLVMLGLLAATAIPSLASAQSGRELRQDQLDVRQERRDVDRAIRDGAPRSVVRDERRDVREARQERREDWRDYRNTHRDLYRGPRYAGPRGYAYRPVSVGYRFEPGYYDQRYWVNDYGRYRLAAPGRNERWVRYGNDVVRINLRTGRVVAVNNGFFF